MPLIPIPAPLIVSFSDNFIIVESLLTYPEKTLVDRLINDDVQAFKLIFTAYYKTLLRYAMKFVMDFDSAENIVQQTFLYIWERRKTGQIDYALKSYLFRAVHNACINHLKQDNRKKDYIKAFLLEVNRDYNVGALYIRSETMEALSEKLERRYNVKFIFDDEEFKEFAYSGMITNETLDQVLAAIRFASPIQYIIDEGIVTLKINSEYSSMN